MWILSFVPNTIGILDFEGNDLTRIENFNRSRFPDLKYLKISNNQFPCDRLSELVQEWNGTIDGDPWEQKHGKDCRLQRNPKPTETSTENANQDDHNKNTETHLNADLSASDQSVMCFLSTPWVR